MIDHMAQLGYNTIRVPYAGDALKSGAVATSVNTNTNPDLVGLSPLQILDRVVDYAGSLGMRVILDRHRPTSAGQTALWYTPTVSEASMIADWQMLARHYAGNTTVVGADLFNEPHAEGTYPNGTGSCWGCGDTARDWRLAAERIGNAVHAANPNWLVLVEGVSCLDGSNANVWDSIPDDPNACSWWGGNLSGVAKNPVRLTVANKLVYSAHDYGISVYDHQDWFDTTKHPDFPANLPAVWDYYWGYISKQNIAPVLVGEFGSTLRDPRDAQWMTTLVSYMRDQRHVLHVLVVEPGLRRHRRHRAGRLGHGEHEQAVHPPARPGAAGQAGHDADRYPDARHGPRRRPPRRRRHRRPRPAAAPRP